MVFTFLENHWIYAFFTHAPVPHSKLLVEFVVSLKTEGVGGSYDLLYQIQSENMKMNRNISLFPFIMIAIFLNVMALQFWK